MKKHSILGLSLFTALVGAGCIVGCGSSSDGGGNTPGGAAGAAGAGTAGKAPTAGAAGVPTSAGSGGAPASGGASGSAGSAGNAGSGGTCAIPALEVFQRSDTDQSWDDNDFSDVMLSADNCPKLVNVTWPHEEGWQNADPANADHESTHFTLDSYSSVDLTNKKLSLTIELAADMRGAAATAGSYIVSLVSVSTFDRVVGGGGAGAAGTDAGGASGSAGAASGAGGASGSSGASGSGGSGGTNVGGAASGSGGDSSGGTAGAAVVTETGYTEAESPLAERATLRFVGDRATVSFPLPKKTSEVSSYDPTRAIKINIRIYSAFSNGETTGVGGAGGMAGVGGASGGSGGTAGASGSAGASANGGVSGASAGSAGTSGSGGAGAVAPTYAYMSSQFAITDFSIKDATAP